MYYNGCFFTKNPSQALSGKIMHKLAAGSAEASMDEGSIKSLSCNLGAGLRQIGFPET